MQKNKRMPATTHLRTDLPVITPKNSISEAVQLFEERGITHLPIFEATHFLGMLSKENIMSQSKEESLALCLYDLEMFFAQENTHWQAVLEVFGKYDTNIVPVFNDENQYQGYFFLIDFIHLFAQTPFLKEYGSFIVLEKNSDDYSFSEIAQIVESNHGKILGMLVSGFSGNKTQITLKIVSNALSEILQSFRRYGYAILLEKEDDAYLKDLKDNSDYFEKYLTL